MESAEAVAAKRKVLIDALMMCLGKSRIVQVVDARTVRSVLDSASGDMWREGEFRLEPVWKILIAQPELTAEDVAPPLLTFKAYENELGVQVRIPQALSAIPRGEQVRLRDALGIQRADFAKAIDEMKTLAASEAAAAKQQELLRAAESTVDEPSAKKATPKSGAAKKPNKALAGALALVAVVAIGLSMFFAFRDTAQTYDLADCAAVLQLGNGHRAGPSLTATITDGKWAALPLDEKKKVVSQVMDIEVQKGVRSLVLSDGSGKTAALANETPDGRVVVVP